MSTDTSNRLLESLSPENQERILASCKPTILPVRTPLYDVGERPRYAYFMTSGLASVVIELADGGTVEVGLIGNEGVAGGLYLLGPSALAGNCFMQMEGTGLRIPFAELRKIFSEEAEVRDRILEFVQSQSIVTMQVAACNKLHETEARLARWLLMVQDRIDSQTLLLTQEFLAQMLGTQRTTVAVVAGVLQRAGLIDYRRGKVHIIDRERLLEAACSCYGVCGDTFAGLYLTANYSYDEHAQNHYFG